jgi:hypothetical protein
MDDESQIPLFAEPRLSRVDAHADGELQPGRPGVKLESALRRDGCSQSGVRVGEAAEELVRSAVDFDPARCVDGGSEQAAVISEQVTVVVAQLLHQGGRPLDVGEEKGDSPARQLRHRDHLRSGAALEGG